MKNLKKLTYTAKRLLSAEGEDVTKWAIKHEDSYKFVLVNKETGEERELEK